MLNWLSAQSEFTKNVAKLVTGTTIAQAIPLLISPVLTRLYSPEEFGLFALYISAVSVVAAIACARYEQAIIIPDSDKEASYLLILCALVSLVVAAIVLPLLWLLGPSIAQSVGRPEILEFAYVIPFSIIVISWYQCLRIYNNREKRYTRIAASRVVESGTNAAVGVAAGSHGFGSIGLVLAAFLSNVIGFISLGRGLKIEKFSLSNLKEVAYRYSKFPKVDVPSTLLNASAQQAPNFLFSPLFSATFAGYYFLVQRIFLSPIKVISTAIAEVFRQEAARRYSKNGKVTDLFLATTKKLVVLSIVPFTVLMFAGEYLFSVVFGEEWGIAGVYAQVLAPMFMLKFVVSPLTYIFYITNRLEYDFYGQLAYFITLLSSIMVGFFYSSTLLTIALISVSGSFIYVCYWVVSYRLSKGENVY